ncbi:MAG: MBL fold metallo-hydrolase [Deltaproteobacteria bacterium]|nr:MBL fold metallo-hydrolase [Deltaproteobacteria bacterium]
MTSVTATDQARSARERRVSLSRRFRDGAFHNTDRTRSPSVKNGLSVMGEFLFKREGRSPSSPLPLFGATAATLRQAPSALRVTWLGHSTVLIEIDGVRLLTDPVWGERASPFTLVGPKRFHPPPLPLAELPPVDAVLLTHDHYDHLCASTVRALAAGAVPGFSGRFITALGVGAHLERLGVPAPLIEELDWGEGTKVGDVDVVAVPAQHFSGRGPLDRNRTLWAGFAVLGPRHRVFTSGDTGPTDEHVDIGASFGPFDVVLFEIGAYHPAWGDIHLGPDAAYQAFVRANARALLPVHWGTFDLALHEWQEPAETLFTRAQGDGAELWTPLLGEPIDVAAGTSRPTRPWWRDVLRR